MAVSLNLSDVKQPMGELADSFFPDADLDTQLPGWLTKAKARVEANGDIATAVQNDAAAAWVYYLAYTYIANRLAAMPNSSTVDGGEVTTAFGQDRIAYWLARAEASKAEYAEFIVPVDVAVTSTPRDSFPVQVQAVW